MKKSNENNLAGFIEENENKVVVQKKKITTALMPKFIIFSSRRKSKKSGFRGSIKSTDLQMYANNDYSCIGYILEYVFN